MKIGFLKEVKDTRVAISPLVVLKYEKIGIEIGNKLLMLIFLLLIIESFLAQLKPNQGKNN